MASITLNRQKLKKLTKFCADHQVDQWFIAKDRGAYVGAVSRNGDAIVNCLFYFAGCNPDIDEDWYDTASAKFGGDDFGEHFGVGMLTQAMEDSALQKIKITVGETNISIEAVKAAQ